MLPSLSDWVTGDKITVSKPFFDAVDVPIGIFLLFLTGVGPLLAWRKASTNSLKRNFMIPSPLHPPLERHCCWEACDTSMPGARW